MPSTDSLNSTDELKSELAVVRNARQGSIDDMVADIWEGEVFRDSRDTASILKQLCDLQAKEIVKLRNDLAVERYLVQRLSKAYRCLKGDRSSKLNQPADQNNG